MSWAFEIGEAARPGLQIIQYNKVEICYDSFLFY